MVVAQLVDRSLPTPETCSSFPVIGSLHIDHYWLTISCTKNENKEKEAVSIQEKTSKILRFESSVLFTVNSFPSKSPA